MEYVNHNGRIIRKDKPSIAYDNRSFRFGDGLFETMRWHNNAVVLNSLHFDRLMNGISLMEFDLPESWNPGFFIREIEKTCHVNRVSEGRIRLTLYRGNGPLKNGPGIIPGFLVETFPEEWFKPILPERGLHVDVYPKSVKSCDSFSNLKSNNFLPYLMGSIYAESNRLDDCLILNPAGRISDSTIANVFWVRGKTIFTVPLSEGPVAGVMRRYLLEQILPGKYQTAELAAGIESLCEADEIFLTNAIAGIRWVERFRNRAYGNKITSIIYNHLTGSFNKGAKPEII